MIRINGKEYNETFTLGQFLEVEESGYLKEEIDVDLYNELSQHIVTEYNGCHRQWDSGVPNDANGNTWEFAMAWEIVVEDPEGNERRFSWDDYEREIREDGRTPYEICELVDLDSDEDCTDDTGTIDMDLTGILKMGNHL